MKKYFYSLFQKYIEFYLRPELCVLEVNYPGQKQILSSSNNVHIVARDPSKQSLKELVTIINKKNPDIILCNGSLHKEFDLQEFLSSLSRSLPSHSRIIFNYYSNLWRPLANLASFIGIREKNKAQNWITKEDIKNLFHLSNLDPIRAESKVILPFYIPLLSGLFNRIIVNLPLLNLFSMVNIVVSRPLKIEKVKYSYSILVPARNEEGNIENIVKRVKKLDYPIELIFVEGNSIDNTWNKILEIKAQYSGYPIKTFKQSGKGKGDAVRKGFDNAENDILVILDADLTVPPEDLPKFFNAIEEGKGEFINGSRLVYPMENEAMRFFNIIGNKFFAMVFSFLIGQAFKDTLCGTKVISRKNYIALKENRKYFGDFDPFGDFDLIFGATKLGLKIVEVPIRYRNREYGDTNISRWKHGVILLRMSLYAATKIKFI